MLYMLMTRIRLQTSAVYTHPIERTEGIVGGIGDIGGMGGTRGKGDIGGTGDVGGVLEQGLLLYISDEETKVDMLHAAWEHTRALVIARNRLATHVKVREILYTQHPIYLL